jgi:hypothetical protein
MNGPTDVRSARKETAMPVVLLTMCIATLFGGWVWTLKQEMRAMRRRLEAPDILKPEPSPVLGTGTIHERITEHGIRGKQVPVVAGSNGVQVKREYNGVQTFVIDA